jgi:acetyl esterase/lipase
MFELTTVYWDEPIVWRRAVDIACPSFICRRTALFYVHGGGWVGGARDNFHHHLAYFSKLGYICASAGYRLVSDVTWKEQLDDVTAAYKQFTAWIRERELEIDRIIVIGSSAGAHLASMLVLTGDVDPLSMLPLAACVSINGPAGLEPFSGMNEEIKILIDKALGIAIDSEEENGDLYRRASPNRHIGPKAPDFLFILAGNEPYFPHAQIYDMSDQLRNFGKRAEVVCVPNANHGFLYELKTDQQLLGLHALKTFIESYER